MRAAHINDAFHSAMNVLITEPTIDSHWLHKIVLLYLTINLNCVFQSDGHNLAIRQLALKRLLICDNSISREINEVILYLFKINIIEYLLNLLFF